MTVLGTCALGWCLGVLRSLCSVFSWCHSFCSVCVLKWLSRVYIVELLLLVGDPVCRFTLETEVSRLIRPVFRSVVELGHCCPLWIAPPLGGCFVSVVVSFLAWRHNIGGRVRPIK